MPEALSADLADWLADPETSELALALPLLKPERELLTLERALLVSLLLLLSLAELRGLRLLLAERQAEEDLMLLPLPEPLALPGAEKELLREARALLLGLLLTLTAAPLWLWLGLVRGLTLALLLPEALRLPEAEALLHVVGTALAMLLVLPLLLRLTAGEPEAEAELAGELL